MIENTLGVPSEWTSHTVRANGIDIHYVRTGGDGPPLVIAHGAYDDALCREPLIDELVEDYDVLAYDARGHGRSSAPKSGYEMDERVADLVGLLDALGIETVTLLGHSMGGDTVAAAAAAHTDRVRALVLIDPAAMLLPIDDSRDPAAEARETISEWHTHTKDEHLEYDPGISGFVERGERRLAERLAEARLRVDPAMTAVFEDEWVDPRETYPKIEAPTLVLKADTDEDGRARDREIAGELPDGRLVHVDGADHTVVRDEREVATRELRAFLDSI